MMKTPKFHEPYSPAIMETEVPKKFIDIVNSIADEVLSDEQKSQQWDFSHRLVGKVNKEIQLPIRDKTEGDYLKNIMKQGCLDYLKFNLDKQRAHVYNHIVGKERPTLENIHLTQSWIVSQYAGDFNPIHHHTADFSAAIYLKVPKDMVDDQDDHAPSKGMIEFAFGDTQNFRNDSVKFLPEVGKFLVFPSWLKHFVYPFTCKGERRMMSFNATIRN
jgi:hypothetical protein